jgi:hypothetical protein
MNNKDNGNPVCCQWLAAEFPGKSSGIHEVLHAVSINPLHSPAMNSHAEFYPQPLAVVDAKPLSGDEPEPHPARSAFIKIPPTGWQPTGERIGHTCD